MKNLIRFSAMIALMLWSPAVVSADGKVFDLLKATIEIEKIKKTEDLLNALRKDQRLAPLMNNFTLEVGDDGQPSEITFLEDNNAIRIKHEKDHDRIEVVERDGLAFEKRTILIPSDPSKGIKYLADKATKHDLKEEMWPGLYPLNGRTPTAKEKKIEGASRKLDRVHSLSKEIGMASEKPDVVESKNKEVVALLEDLKADLAGVGCYDRSLSTDKKSKPDLKSRDNHK